MTVEATLLRAFDEAGGAQHRLERIVPGRRFLLACVRSPTGELLGGLASCRAEQAPDWPERADEAARWLGADEAVQAAIGLATINAVLNRSAGEADGVDWLQDAGRGRHVALVGRFPFIEDELRPIAAEISVFEIDPREGEYGPQDMAARLPEAQVIAITASTILNQTLDGVLAHRAEASRVLLLGPSTPMTAALFDLGIERLAGIVVNDLVCATRDVEAGVSFRQLSGLRRVSLGRDETPASGVGWVKAPEF